MPGVRGVSKTSSLIRFYTIALLILLLDQATKFAAITFLTETGSVPVLQGIFHLTLVHNTGVAFGLFREHGAILLGMITLSVVLLSLWAHYILRAGVLMETSLALILGGAVGNWIDRLRLGSVVDFLDFRIWPVFNVADTAISIGVALYCFLLLKGMRTGGSDETGSP